MTMRTVASRRAGYCHVAWLDLTSVSIDHFHEVSAFAEGCSTAWRGSLTKMLVMDDYLL